MFVNISEVNFKFSNCNDCKNSCCNQKFALAPLILDDFEEVYQNFPLLFGYFDEDLKAVIPLCDGTRKCVYLDDNGMCGIYDSRPPSCQMYPISPYYDEIYVDNSCDAVGEVGEFLCSDKSINKKFYHKRLDNFLPKYQKSLKFFNSLKSNLERLGEISGIELFKIKNFDENVYLNMHKDSIKLLDSKFKNIF
jgi:hypothetical protein